MSEAFSGSGRIRHSRRGFLASALGGVVWPWGASFGRGAVAPSEQRWLEDLLRPKDKTYDPFAKMLVATAQAGPAYHSQLRSGDVHPTRLSLNYAAALLETAERWRIDRARDILRTVLSLQDVDPGSRTYGIWPWYLEEPLGKMSSPDWNWADVCGAALLMVWTGSRKALGPELERSVSSAIVHAAQSIQQRNVQPGETSIAVMGTGVTLIAAQELRLPELRGYARERLRALYDAVLSVGSFSEYNSPTDTIVMLQELARMLLLVRDSRDRALITAVHDLAWKHVATHFHAPTQQWAGPHSRSDETNLAANHGTLAFLQKACQGKVTFHHADPLALNLDAVRLPLSCPRKWNNYFLTLGSARQVVERFIPADPAKPGARSAVIGTTWLHPRFTLGSVNRGDFWAQRRPLVVYWGNPSAPRFLQARFLRNGQDFSSALFFSAQHEGHLLGAVAFATDHGDAHPSLDPIQDGEIRASDLRFSLRLGGALGRCTVRALGDPHRTVLIQDEEVRWVLRPVADGWEGAPFVWDQPSLMLADAISAVGYHGEEKTFTLPKLQEAFLCFTLAEWPYDQKQPPPPQVQGQRQEDRLQARWVVGGKALELDVPTRPAPFAEMNDRARSSVV